MVQGGSDATTASDHTLRVPRAGRSTSAAPGRENRRASVDSNVDSPSLRLHDSRSGPLTLQTSNRASLLNSEVEVVYARIDVDNSGTISESQFVRAVQELGLEQSEAEVRRIFSQLATTDEGLPKTEFLKAVQRNTFLQTVVSAYVSPKASVAEDYDFRLPTYINHRHPHYVGEKADGTSSRAKYREDVHGPVYGSYAALRKELDYSWHTNYTCSRQRWQDTVVTNVASSPLTADDKRPWLLWTCGPMGAGKGYAMDWLSRHGISDREVGPH
jgi:hypothetical protein